MSIRRLFVYGTLKPGHLRWPALAAFVDPHAPVQPAEVEGQLRATPWGWPALTVGPHRVRGVLVTLQRDRVADALRCLDEIEGVDIGLFDRVETTTRTGILCSMYLWRNDIAGFAPLDDGHW